MNTTSAFYFCDRILLRSLEECGLKCVYYQYMCFCVG